MQWKVRPALVAGLLVIGVAASISGCAASNPGEGAGDFDSVTLQYANPASEKDAQAFAGTVSVWMDEVAQLTDGAVQFNSSHGGSLLGLGDMMKGVGDGLSDLGSAQLSTDPAAFPSWALAGIHDPEVGTQMTAYDQTMITRIMLTEFDQLQKELDDSNLQFIFSIASSPHHLLTKEPLSALSDLQGRTIRTYGSFMPTLFQSVGASTVNMPSDELYTAMERSVVDGAYSLPAFFLSSSMGEVAKQLTLVGNGTTPPLNAGYHLTMNKDVWDGLSAATKKAFLEAGRTAEVQYSKESVPADEKKAIDAMASDFNVDVVEMSESDIDVWSEKFPDVWADLAKDLDGQGLPGSDMVKRYKELAAMSTEEIEVLYAEAWDTLLQSIK
jgi:TRAP-type C4-dicarboxylate transport system substrate-binding protein